MCNILRQVEPGEIVLVLIGNIGVELSGFHTVLIVSSRDEPHSVIGFGPACLILQFLCPETAAVTPITMIGLLTPRISNLDQLNSIGELNSTNN